MKLYLMKQDALDTIKENLPTIFGKYYTEPNNKWIYEICKDPFVEYKEIPEFKLADLDSDLMPGEIDLNNCKIIYEKLQFLSESQASDERLWAGLTHTVFYEYMKKRWGYGFGKKPKSAEKEAGAIKARFFYGGSGRTGFYRNTLSKCWWVGHSTYDPNNLTNHFEALDIIGSNDLNSKVTEFFYNFTFSSNPDVLAAIIEALRRYKEERRYLSVREHIRPALSYLNAVGGSVVIDCLEQEEITDIFYDAIEAIMQGDEPSVRFDAGINEEDIIYDEEDQIEQSNYSEQNIDRLIEEKTEVVLGCKVTVQNDSGRQRIYKYDLLNGSLPKDLNVFTGCKTGDMIELKGENWIIIDIAF